MVTRRTIFSSIACLLLVCSMFVGVAPAFAQGDVVVTPPGGSTGGTDWEAVGRAVGEGIETGSAAVTAPEEQASIAAPEASCGLGTIFKPWDWFRCGIRAVAWVILGVAALFLYIAGVLLNLAIVRTVFEFSTLVGNSEGLLLAWGVLRDLGNMLLLFGFIFIGLATILDLQTYAARKALPRLIIFAVLMNFSLFAAEAVIDVSNGLSTVIYKQSSIDPNCVNRDIRGGDSFADCATSSGIASRIMTASGISTLYSIDGLTGSGSGSDVVISTPGYFGLIMLAAVAAVVLFAAAIMFIIRAVILTFLMVVAPLGFAALAVPFLEDMGKKWWKTLLGQSFFAPIFLLLILISLKICEGIASAATTTSLAGALSNGQSGAASVFLVFALVIGFLIASLQAAKKFGAIGADYALNVANKTARAPFTYGGSAMRKVGTTVGGGATGVVGRTLIGKPAARMQKSFTAWAGKKDAEGTRAGNLLRRGFANNVLGVDDLVEGSLGAAKNARFGGKRSYKESVERREKRSAEFAAAADTKREKNNVEEGARELAAAEAAGDLKAIAEANRKIADALQKMSTADIKKSGLLEENNEALRALAINLSPDKFEKLFEDKELGEDKKDLLSQERYSQLRNAIEIAKKDGPADTDGKDARKRIRELSNKDLELFAKINPDDFDRLAKATTNGEGENIISNDQTESLVKNERLTNTQRQTVKSQTRGARLDSMIEAKTATAPEVNKLIDNMTSKQIAKLSGKTLTSKLVVPKLSPASLLAIMSEAKLGEKTRRDLGGQLRALGRKDIQELFDKDANVNAYFSA